MTELAVDFRHFANVPKTVPEILPCAADKKAERSDRDVSQNEFGM
jgi:hypothetical protein